MSYDDDESLREREEFYDNIIYKKDNDMKQLIVDLIKDVKDMINKQDYDSHYDGEGVPQYYIKTEQAEALEDKLFNILFNMFKTNPYGVESKKSDDK